jgi:hypothetical protein
MYKSKKQFSIHIITIYEENSACMEFLCPDGHGFAKCYSKDDDGKFWLEDNVNVGVFSFCSLWKSATRLHASHDMRNLIERR